MAALFWVDLSPRVESDFFFSPDDPQMQATEEIGEAFPSTGQIIVRAAGADIGSETYRVQIGQLTRRLADVPGVTAVNSVATERAERSPLWNRLLLPPGGEATNLILSVTDADARELVASLEGVLAASEHPEFEVEMSGVPVIVELIRRSLFRDLRLFSGLALLVFGLLIAAVYRSAWVVVGTLVSAGLACGVTLMVNQAVGLSIGLLTANIVTIVFVLTLSHIVFLTANARRVGANSAVRVTLPASFWAGVTTLLGFLSLTIASARPLRELGFAGAVGTVVAFLSAYLVYPVFLEGGGAGEEGVVSPAGPVRSGRLPVGLFLGGVAVLGLGVLNLDTDPGLLTYFRPGSEVREGLEVIDRDGGSSTLEVVVRDPEGARLDNDAANERLWAFQDTLEALPDVGVVLSPPVLFGHARLQPLAGFLTLSGLADILQSVAADNVGRSFLSEDRTQGRFYARMHEAERTRARSEVVEQVREAALVSGLEPALVGGVYELQGQLGSLIASSLRIGLGGLLLLFLVIGGVVSRSVRTTAEMFVCLAGIPLVVLGAFGHLRVPIDMITSPAANVALALGVDAMIHLVLRARALGDWNEARRQMRQPILAGALIICVGFGIFVFSSFPPTARFGAAVILGTITAATMALWVLPALAGRMRAEAPVAAGSSGG